VDIPNLQSQVQAQLDELAGKIREAEESLMRLKENFLKVQGAKEMLNIVAAEENKTLTDQEVSPDQTSSATAD
tara:strand:+ start:3753 stop:3971 length:219 start_codon:yes stop_codon:yes gene_type:complete